ncbi:MAG: hypothetical protein A2X59_12135 [Nitrospirae bacterium GWC2_42_7]|nr:MAG: hypothetical protein A2X59_12135 [Nitrospirae bacterium GWC2_42_7]
MEDDIGLVERYIAGETDAIEELVMRYQKQIYAFIYRMTKDMEESKDLTQKTFLNAVKGIRDFRKTASFKTWLYQIAVNTSLNHIKRDKREEVEFEDSVASSQSGALTSILENEKREQVRKSLDTLPERQKLAVILRVYESLSCAETARAMGCSEGTVKAHYHSGVKKLKEVLKEKDYEFSS